MPSPFLPLNPSPSRPPRARTAETEQVALFFATDDHAAPLAYTLASHALAELRSRAAAAERLAPLLRSYCEDDLTDGAPPAARRLVLLGLSRVAWREVARAIVERAYEDRRPAFVERKAATP